MQVTQNVLGVRVSLYCLVQAQEPVIVYVSHYWLDEGWLGILKKELFRSRTLIFLFGRPRVLPMMIYDKKLE